MRCIPTRVLMAEKDPELVSAQARLRAHLASTGRLDGDAMTGPEVSWRYLVSAPFREDDGAIIYVHVFLLASARANESGHPIGIPATRGWWPSGQPTVAPMRTPARAKLRLVS